jgi:hypothetical protein
MFAPYLPSQFLEASWLQASAFPREQPADLLRTSGIVPLMKVGFVKKMSILGSQSTSFMLDCPQDGVAKVVERRT